MINRQGMPAVLPVVCENVDMEISELTDFLTYMNVMLSYISLFTFCQPQWQ